MRRVPIALTTVSLVLGLSSPVIAEAGSVRSSSGCSLVLGTISSSGGLSQQRITSTKPISLSARPVTPEFYPGGLARLAGHYGYFATDPGANRTGEVVLGDALYFHQFKVNGAGEIDPDVPIDVVRIGGGWSRFVAFESSIYYSANVAVRSHRYGLRDDGTLFRWSVSKAGSWQATGSAAGFSAVKTMALISKTATYDTFLANTRGGALYTIRIPVSLPMKPVVKVVRSSTWQGFEALTAARCGQYGTLLLGVDKETGTGFLYAVGHANGTATVIQGLGKVPTTFPDPISFRWAVDGRSDVLFGE